MTPRTSGQRRAARSARAVLWLLAAVAFPALLATLGLFWVRPAEPVADASGALSAVTARASDPPVAVEPGVRERGTAEAVRELLSATPLRFDGESALLRPDAAETAARLAALVAADPRVTVVRLVGHTADQPGPAERSRMLSRDRAAAVADALVAGGVERARLEVEGVGDADPLGTPEASRRVEVVLTLR